jgi:short-subunit dehydrogenase
MSVNSLKNKVVLVTGASGGIGNSIVNELSSEGAAVVAVYHRNSPQFTTDKNVFWIKADIINSEERDNLVAFCLEKYKRIDVLINCAGFLEPAEFSSLEEIYLRKMIDLNFTSTLIITQKVLSIMKSQGSGHIIILGSLGGIVPMPYSAVYSATKFALRGFSFSLAEELKGTGITISLISPGAVDTKMLEDEADDINAAISFTSKPLNPIDVADVILNVIRKPKTEVIIPRGHAFGSKILNLSPVLFHNIYKILHRIGLSGKKRYLNRYGIFNLVKEM